MLALGLSLWITPHASAQEHSVLERSFVRIIPRDTKIPIEILTSLTYNPNQPIQKFKAQTTQDLNIDGAVAIMLPDGTRHRAEPVLDGLRGL